MSAATVPVRQSGHSELDALLDELGRRRYLMHAFRSDRDGPEIVAGIHRWDSGCADCADVVILYQEDRAIAYRVPTAPGTDPFSPGRVFWWYAATPVWTLRALLTLAPPGHPDAPAVLTDAPPGCGVPVANRIPVRIRRRTYP
jgi:hypothetical protein